MEQIDKIKITQKEFDDMYSVIEDDTPQPDLDKLKHDTELTEDVRAEEHEESFLTEEEEQHDVQLHQDLPQEEDK